MNIRYPDHITIYTETETYKQSFEKNIKINDIDLSFDIENDGLDVKVTATETPISYVRLRWNFTADEKRKDAIKILGDSFERGYGDLRWAGIEPERTMPWYVLVSNGSDAVEDTAGRRTEGFGVKVQCFAFVQWQYDEAGISMWADIRSGGMGVVLGGKTLDICTVVFGDYKDVTAFKAGQEFCKKMCPANNLPKHKIYGSNNWYYAYGKSSREEIISDTKIVVEQCKGIENIPYMVIDDGWTIYGTNAPWESNEKFGDMKTLADEMRSMGARPGIWVRYLTDEHFALTEAKPDWFIKRGEKCPRLDPTHPEVLEYVKKVTRRVVDWGYELIKHDYSSHDISGGFTALCLTDRYGTEGWHLYDRSKTTAQATVEFYRTVKEAAGEDCIIIGCNTVSHLCAGMYELNRTGDDTSGFDWSRTRRMGVNTLAFRLIQNGIFYMADADCVGITGAISWDLNKMWLDVLSKSGSPLFVSCKPGVLNESELADLKEAWKTNSIQENECRPLDWMENQFPARWLIDGEEVYYNWYTEEGIDSFKPVRK